MKNERWNLRRTHFLQRCDGNFFGHSLDILKIVFLLWKKYPSPSKKYPSSTFWYPYLVRNCFRTLLKTILTPLRFSSGIFVQDENLRRKSPEFRPAQKDFRLVPIPSLDPKKDFRFVPIPSLGPQKDFRLRPYSWDENLTFIFVSIPDTGFEYGTYSQFVLTFIMSMKYHSLKECLLSAFMTQGQQGR